METVPRLTSFSHGAGCACKLGPAQLKEVLACVSRAMPSADWSQIPHQHQKYSITLMATYPPSGGTGGP